MDSSRDHLEQEIAGLRAALDGITLRLEGLERRYQSAKRAEAPDPVPHAAPPIAPVRPAPPIAKPVEPIAPTPPKTQAPPTHPHQGQAVRQRALEHLTSRPQVVNKPLGGDAWSWEKLIGAKAFAAAGALIVVLGVAFFLKLAIDEGWIRSIPPVWRCVAVGGFGCVLILLGEIARKKISTLASSGLSAAGIATVYASVYGAHEVFGLIAPPVAMVMLACVTAGGIALGVIGRRVFLSIISLVGAYLAPVLLSTGEPSPVFFPAYLVALLALGLTLGGWMGRRFQCLRSLSWWGTMLLGTFWLIDWALRAAPANALVFIGVVWALTHAELIASARFFRGVEEPEEPTDSSFGLTERTTRRVHAHARWIVSSFGVTTWALAFSILAFRKLNPEWDFLAPVCLGGALTAVSVIAMPRIMELVSNRRTPRPPNAQLATATVIQVGAMVIAAVALGLTEWSQVIAWLALGVAAIVAGKHIGAGGVRALRIYGMVLLCIGTARLVVLDWIPVFVGVGPPAAVWTQGWGLVLGPVGAQLIGAGVAWFIGAIVSRRWRADSAVMASIGIACILGAAVMPGAHAGSIATAWALIAAAVMALSRTRCVPFLSVIGVGPIVASWLAWLTAYGNPDAWSLDDGSVIAPVGLAQAGAIILAGLIGPALVRREDRSRRATVVVLGGTGLMVIAAVGLGLSGWVQVATWLALGLGCVIGGQWMRRPALRIYGTCLLAIGTARVMILEWMPVCFGLEESTRTVHGVWGLAFGSVSAQLAGAALAWLMAAAVVRARATDSFVMAIVGTVCAMVLFVMPEAHAGSIAAAWAVLGLGLAVVSRTGWIAKLGAITTAVVTVAWIPWLVAHLNPDVWVASGGPPMLSLGMRQAMVIAAAGIMSACVQRSSDWRHGAVRLTLAAACGALFIATSFEVHRLVTEWVPGDLTARRAGVSIWWAVIGLGALALGTVRHASVARWIGLGLLAAAAAKLVVFDLIEISMVWRVVASMVIGLILLGVAVGYARAMRRSKDVEPAPVST